MSKLYEASRGAEAGEVPELAKKYGESLKEAVKTVRDRAGQVEAVLRTDQ